MGNFLSCISFELTSNTNKQPEKNPPKKKKIILDNIRLLGLGCGLALVHTFPTTRSLLLAKQQVQKLFGNTPRQVPKKSVFLLWAGGFTLPTLFSGPTTKTNNFFMCVITYLMDPLNSSLRCEYFQGYWHPNSSLRYTFFSLIGPLVEMEYNNIEYFVVGKFFPCLRGK